MAEHIYHTDTMNKLNKTAINIELHTFSLKVYFITLSFFPVIFCTIHSIQAQNTNYQNTLEEENKKREHRERSICFFYSSKMEKKKPFCGNYVNSVILVSCFIITAFMKR